VTHEDVGLVSSPEDELAGGAPDENARIIRAVLAGERSDAARTAVVMNAGAAIYVSGQASTLAEGVLRAAASLDSGAALGKLEALREASRL
jgi:anthranilate phosphoribosyltransferase